MDKGVWIAIGVLILATIGFFLLQVLPINTPSASPQSSDSSATQATQAPETVTDQTSCESVAQAAAQNDNASLVAANFNSSRQCYYELDTFGASGNVASINLAPGDAVVASCATAQDGSLSCNEGGSSISEPQFKSLLSTYIPQ